LLFVVVIVVMMVLDIDTIGSNDAQCKQRQAPKDDDG